MTEDEIVGHEFEQTLGDAEGQRGLACCSPWGLRGSDTTGRPNNNGEEINDEQTEKKKMNRKILDLKLNMTKQKCSLFACHFLSSHVSSVLGHVWCPSPPRFSGQRFGDYSRLICLFSSLPLPATCTLASIHVK